ncbi:MAG: hypothetical protein Q9199_005334 [Rusavskia elegans]
MLRLTTYLILALSSLSVSALPTVISPTAISTTPYTSTLTFTPLGKRALDKRALDLPNNWHFILASQPSLFEPIHVAARAIISLYTAVIARASQVSVPPDHAASFKVGVFVLLFTGGGAEDGKPLDWATVIEFCKRMRHKAHMGEPLLVEGWLMNRETEEYMYVKLGWIKEISGSP